MGKRSCTEQFCEDFASEVNIMAFLCKRSVVFVIVLSRACDFEDADLIVVAHEHRNALINQSVLRKFAPASNQLSSATSLSQLAHNIHVIRLEAWRRIRVVDVWLSELRLWTSLSNFPDFLGRLQPSKTTIQKTPGTLGVEKSCPP